MIKKDFDKIIHSKLEDIAIIDYGIVNGNNIIVFIKAGQNGSLYGYENKYLQIALNINYKYGYTVICSSNPFDGNNPLDNAMEVIDNYCIENNYKDYKIYYMGHSNGGLIGLWFGVNYEKIERMLVINTPLMYNWHKTKEGIQKFKGNKLTIVYGSEDQSINYVGLISLLENDVVKLKIIEGQDHHFSKDTYDFKKLPEEFLC